MAHLLVVLGTGLLVPLSRRERRSAKSAEPGEHGICGLLVEVLYGWIAVINLKVNIQNMCITRGPTQQSPS